MRNYEKLKRRNRSNLDKTHVLKTTHLNKIKRLKSKYNIKIRKLESPDPEVQPPAYGDCEEYAFSGGVDISDMSPHDIAAERLRSRILHERSMSSSWRNVGLAS